MSDDDDETDDSEKPTKPSFQLIEIKRLMALEGIDYEIAYNRVMYPKPKEPEPIPTPTPLPEPKPQVTIEKLNELVASLNSDDMAQIELATEELGRLEEIVGQQNVRNIELSATLKRRLGQLQEIKKTLETKQKQNEEQEVALKKQLLDLDKQKDEFNKKVAENKRKRKGYTKTIKSAAEKEFEEET
jgi:hypothetical protein